MNEFKLSEKELKKEVLAAVREKALVRYSHRAMDEIIDEVMREDGIRASLKVFVRNTLQFVQGDKAFEKQVKEEFQRKVAKSMVGKLEGTVERAVDAIRQDLTLRSEMILAIEKIIKDNLPS